MCLDEKLTPFKWADLELGVLSFNVRLQVRSDACERLGRIRDRTARDNSNGFMVALMVHGSWFISR